MGFKYKLAAFCRLQMENEMSVLPAIQKRQQRTNFTAVDRLLELVSGLPIADIKQLKMNISTKPRVFT